MEEKGIKIERAKPEDARAINEVFYRSWLLAYPNEEYGITSDDIEAHFKGSFSDEKLSERASVLADTDSPVKQFVAKDGGEIVGICIVIERESANQLQAIYLLPECQGKGIGKKLWERAKEELSEEKETIVHVAVYNEQAINFYKKLGFVDTGKRFEEKRYRMKSRNIIPEMEMVKKAERLPNERT